MEGQGLIGMQEASKLLGVSRGTLTRWAKSGLAPYIRIRGRYLFSMAQLEKFITAHSKNKIQ